MIAPKPTACQPLPNLSCPLCGQANGCAPAASASFDTPCWCAGLRFDQELLQRVPADLRGKACICATCAQAGKRPL